MLDNSDQIKILSYTRGKQKRWRFQPVPSHRDGVRARSACRHAHATSTFPSRSIPSRPRTLLCPLWKRLPFVKCKKSRAEISKSIASLLSRLCTLLLDYLFLADIHFDTDSTSTPRVCTKPIERLWQVSKWTTLDRQRTRSLQRFSTLLFDHQRLTIEYTDCLRRRSSAGGRCQTERNLLDPVRFYHCQTIALKVGTL
jgi:hypothetical protein